MVLKEPNGLEVNKFINGPERCQLINGLKEPNGLERC